MSIQHPLDIERLRPLVLVGFRGAGKTTIGELVARRAGTVFVDLDSVVESMRAERIQDAQRHLGEGSFRALESELLPVALRPGLVVALGAGTLTRHENVDLVRREGFGVWLDAPPEVLAGRLAAADERPLDEASGPGGLESLLESRMPGYSAMHARVDAAGAFDDVADRVLELWLSARA